MQQAPVTDLGGCKYFVCVALCFQATTRLRDFIMQKIYVVRRPMSNLQMQQNTLVKFREGFRFLTTHSRQVAAEIKQEYIETFGKVHWSYFNEYMSRLMRLQVGFKLLVSLPTSPSLVFAPSLSSHARFCCVTRVRVCARLQLWQHPPY